MLENHFGERPHATSMTRLSIAELDAVSDRLKELWAAQAEEPVPGGGSLLGGWLTAFWSEPNLRQDLSDALLYYPKLVVLDPLADFFQERSALPPPHGIRYRRSDGAYNIVSAGAKLWSEPYSFGRIRGDATEAALRFSSLVTNLFDLEQPIRRGVVTLRDQWNVLGTRRQQLATSMRHDLASAPLQELVKSVPPDSYGLTVWDNLRGMAVTMDGAIAPADKKYVAEPYFFYLNKMLAVADAAGSQYVPSNEPDLRLLRQKVATAADHRHPTGLLREISRVIVPSADIPLREAVAIRASSSDFEDWRSTIDNIRRDGSADSPEELRDRIEDQLRPRVRALERELQHGSLARQLREGGADLVIDAAVGATVSTLSGQPLVGVAAAAASGAVQWIRKAYSRERPHGADAVLATLITSPR